MNNHILQLIKLAKEGGSLTENQKKLILREAESVNEDLDAVEMLLSTIPVSHDSSADSSKPQSSASSKRRCPNCGAVLSDVGMKCPECGYVFETLSANLSSRKLFEELRSAKNNEQKIQLIKSFPIPNSKEDLLEFLLMSRPYLNNSKGPLASAYLIKYAECIGRCKQFFPNDPDFSEHIVSYEKVLKNNDSKKNKRNRRVLLFFLLIALAAVLYLAMPFLKDFSSKKAVSYNNKRFISLVSNGELSSAAAYLDKFLKSPSQEKGQYSLNDISVLLKDHINSPYCKDCPSKADTLLNYLLKLPEEYQFESKEEFWLIVKKICDYHMEENDLAGVFNILDIYDSRYPSDPVALCYQQYNVILSDLRLGDMVSAKETYENTEMALASSSFETKESALSSMKKLIQSTKDFVSFGYQYETQSGLILSIYPKSSADLNGIRVGDVLVDREFEKKEAEKRKAAVMQDKAYKHVIHRGDSTYVVELKYGILPLK